MSQYHLSWVCCRCEMILTVFIMSLWSGPKRTQTHGSLINRCINQNDWSDEEEDEGDEEPCRSEIVILVMMMIMTTMGMRVVVMVAGCSYTRCWCTQVAHLNLMLSCLDLAHSVPLRGFQMQFCCIQNQYLIVYISLNAVWQKEHIYFLTSSTPETQLAG